LHRGLLPKIDVPALVIHGDDDQIVLLSVGGARSARADYINKDRLNADLLEFVAQKAQLAAAARRVKPEDRRADQEQQPS